MNRARVLALVLAATMLLPVLPLPTAAAEIERVSFRPDVVYTDVKSQNVLYLQSILGQLGGGSATGSTPILWTYPPTQDDVPRSETYAITSQTSGGQLSNVERAIFPLANPLRGNVTVTGNDAFHVRLFVNSPQVGLPFTVEVQETGTNLVIARGTLTGPAGEGTIEGDLPFVGASKRNHTFARNGGLRVVVSAQSATPVDAQTSGGTWTLRYGNDEFPSALTVVTQDAVKVAAWVEDEDKRVTTAFRHDRSAGAKNWVRGFFLVKSAFGFMDFDDNPGTGAVTTQTPQFERPRETTATAELLRNQAPISFTDVAGEVTRVELVRDSEFSAESEGRVLYRFDAEMDHIDYSNQTAKPPGAYELRFRVQFRPDDATNQAPSSLSAVARFAIATGGVSLVAWPGSDGAPAESTSHQIAAGRSSTFVLLAHNSGEVYDNLTLQLAAVPGPQPGWGASLGGPGLKSGNRVELAPKTSALVTLTIQSPANAAIGDGVTYQILGRSQVDPTLQTTPLGLRVNVVNPTTTRAEPGVIVLADDTLVRAGSTAVVPAYLWNRGSGEGDLAMGLDAVDAPGWRNQSLVYAGVQRTDKLTVEQVQPGQIVEVGVHVSAVRASAAAKTYTIRVNATTGTTTDPPTEDIVFKADESAGFLLRMLNGIGGANAHTVEMERAETSNDPRDLARNRDRDALGGTWFRLWITNVGSSDETFTVEAKSYVETPSDANFTDQAGRFSGGARHAWGERNVERNTPNDQCPGAGCPPVLGFRKQNGEFTGTVNPPASLGTTVPAGRTQELYVWVSHEGNHDRFQMSNYRFDIVVTGRDSGTQIISGSAIGWDACTASQPSQAQQGVYACGTTGYDASPGIEAVSRDPDYDTNHLVDITFAEKRGITGRIGPTENTTYRLRATNAATFRSFLTQNDVRIPSYMTIAPKHDIDAGWNVRLRFVGQTEWLNELRLHNTEIPVADGRATDPKDQPFVNFAPPSVDGTRSQSFFDREVEMLVEPPNATSGKRVFAGESHVVVLEGRIRHPILGTQSDALTVSTIIAHKPEVNITSPMGADIWTVAGEPGYTGIFLHNNGSAPTTVRLFANVTGPGGTGVWQVTPSTQDLVLTPRQNRTIALQVTPPTNVPVGSVGEAKVEILYRLRDDDYSVPPIKKSLTVRATVLQTDSIDVTVNPASVTTEPRRTVDFTITVKNNHQAKATYRVDSILVPNWTASLTPVLTDVPPNGGEKTAAFVMTVPGDIVSDTSFQLPIRVLETGRSDDIVNADYAVATVNIAGGQAVPSLQTNKAQQTIERNGTVKFEFGVRNLGNVPGRFPIALIGPNALGWRATVTDDAGRVLNEPLLVNANARRTVNLTISAPVDVPEGTVQEVELQVLKEDRSGGDRVTVKTVIHDYGLDIRAEPPRADLVPGLQATFNVRVFNLGNDNDTFNLSLDMGTLADLWTYEYGQLKVRVPPGEFRDVRLTVRSPKDNLPTPRSVVMTAYAGSEGAANLSRTTLAKLDTVPLTLTVLDYRVGDVDNDGLLEVAVDLNKRRTDGFEQFREIYTTGTLSQAIESAQDVVTGHTRFLIDVPTGGSYDGIADVFWDPDASSVTRIQFTADVNFDGSPDYFLDINADTLVDRVYDSGGRRYLTVEAKDILGRGLDRKQYLVYTDADRFPDAFYDNEKNEVWKVVPSPSVGENVVGFIPKDKTKPTLYYDVAAERVYQSPLVDSLEFFKEYWYAVVAFAGAAVVLGVAIARRKPT